MNNELVLYNLSFSRYDWIEGLYTSLAVIILINKVILEWYTKDGHSPVVLISKLAVPRLYTLWVEML